MIDELSSKKSIIMIMVWFIFETISTVLLQQCKSCNFYEYVKFGAMLWKLIFWSITFFRIRIWKSFRTYVTHLNVINYRTPHFVSTEPIFSYLQIPLQNFAVFFFFFTVITLNKERLKTPALLTWNAFQKGKLFIHFSQKLFGSNNCFTLIVNNFEFLVK